MTAADAMSGIDWEDAFANAAYIQEGALYPDRWAAEAAAFRASTAGHLTLAYGDGPRHTLDLFQPDGPARGLAVFVHGGFWMRFDPSVWSHLAAGALARGWAVALPGYTLAPAARIAAMTGEIAAAIGLAAARVAGPIRLAGHSAGGHLVSRMICGAAPEGIVERIERVVSISGVHDLRPLRLHSMNATLGIDDTEAETESPVLLAPAVDADFVAWVGADERPEFLRQTAVITEAWRRHGARVRRVVEADRHHFSVIEGLVDAGHPLTEAWVG